ncbi:MAG: hypothetical protein MJB12_18415 [Firmicutes bacterium]|nr:hypothetical protein [Bacillota bacterium]
MSKKVYKMINNVLYAVFVLTTLYAFIDMYIIKGAMTAGSCPLDNNRPLLYTAISLGVISFIFSFLKKWLTSGEEG